MLSQMLRTTDHKLIGRMYLVTSFTFFMFGGVGLASAIGAMERTTGRPLIWGTAQYLSYARPPSVVAPGGPDTTRR